MIGITLSSSAFKRLVKRPHKEGSHLEAYRPLADKYKVDLCFYTINRMKKTDQIKGYVYTYKHKTFEEKVVHMPKVSLYRNSSYIYKRKHVQKIQKLQKEQEVHIINVPLNRQRNKLKNHHYLESTPDIRQHLPHTTTLTFSNLTRLLDKYGKVVIKPVFGSRGRRITVIEKQHHDYLIRKTKDPKQKTKKDRYVVSKHQLQRFFKQHFARPSAYLVQQWIPLLTHNGRPFDLRLAVQKNKKRKWQVTSCVARTAGPKSVVTNLEQGGTMISFRELKLKKYKRHIHDVGLKMAAALEKKYPHAADIGIDLALDQHHHVWFIEANFCSHKKHWSTIYRIPFQYAYTLYKNLLN